MKGRNQARNPFTDANFRRLEAFLGADDSRLLASELDGFMTAIACGPETILPSEWLDVVLGSKDALESIASDELQTLLGLIIDWYNVIVYGLTEAQGALAPILEDRKVGRRTVVDGTMWCVGFMRGVAL